MDDLLDIFNIVKGFKVIEAALDPQLSSEARELTIAKILVPEPSDETLANVHTNLDGVFPLPDRLIEALRCVLEVERGGLWKVDATGRVDNPPSLAKLELPAYAALVSASVSQEETALLRQMLFANAPPEMVAYPKVRGLREAMCNASTIGTPPHAIVTVGAPGSGKSYILEHGGLDQLRRVVGSPILEDYVHIDPDYMISNLCENNNEYRMLANFCNHETFLATVSQRRNLLFDATGKDLLNTCGRIISRLRAAGYRVYIFVVISCFQSCLHRIKLRQEITGRGVPEKFVRMAFDGMKVSVPYYVNHQREIAEAVYVYENSMDGPLPNPKILSSETGSHTAEEVLSASLKRLSMPEA